MSIAVSVVLHPSQFLLRYLRAFAVVLLIAGVSVACLDELPVVVRSVNVVLCWLGSAYLVVFSHRLHQRTGRLSVSGLGQLRYQSCLISLPVSKHSLNQRNDPLFYLSSGTTLWPSVLFLRLRRPAHNSILNLVIFSDSLGLEDYRRLSVACHWIVAHSEAAHLRKIVTYGTKNNSPSLH